MLYGLYLSAGGLRAQELRQSVQSNNLANAGTYGFKRDLVAFQTRMNAVDEDPAMAAFRTQPYANISGGVMGVSGGIDLSQGGLQRTSNPADLALSGPGFFRVQGDNGQTLLTRNGQFILDSEGNLLTFNDHRPVLSDAGTPVKLNPSLPFTVSKNGAISQGEGQGVQLGVTDVKDPRQLEKVGNNYLTADSKNLVAKQVTTSVLQNTLENSGVDPIVEMVNMMQGQRAFDANAKLIQMQDQTLQQINAMGRVA